MRNEGMPALNISALVIAFFGFVEMALPVVLFMP
ncbi:Uncharacterised protein [Enterobacter bugandensis]|uniref:Uncharacterized protein n=1 Tax=Enterobacter bugandensis TaxID=881260 RepID=A0A822WRG1_9ENTR|nr:Uncharacterised protein [Enterobacter bugandensis]